eukprot:CAMPEP_0170641842 /NCGR_PEP_ID=MMETSP0224-20130122/40998_1 /TAXON_ID=285029 /ORGANISM="Togula jolla, Strain CCCM 725" /LENGTH=472 /DNA_ID=CAMNT_0010972491 /DNA_START=39 /DNA_END=1458 /DNA_ORIENTATION=-
MANAIAFLKIWTGATYFLSGLIVGTSVFHTQPQWQGWKEEDFAAAAAVRPGQDHSRSEISRVPFYVYDPDHYEPRFSGSLANCLRKGGDYMFLETLLKHPMRQSDPAKADVVVVPCLFESYRRCTTTNHAEKPPAGPDGVVSGGLSNPEEHPEDFEEIPWRKAFDNASAECLAKVQTSETYRRTNGRDHLFVAADWTMNFGKTLQTEFFKNMTVGRIEIVDQIAAAVAHREAGPTQARCSVVVPYASDIAYVEDDLSNSTFEEWETRPKVASFRFEERMYILFCGGRPCPGAYDSTPLRQRSLLMGEQLGEHSGIAVGRVGIEQYAWEISQAKFCLVIRGDTPSSHAFYDALAANCIPVIISDRWADVAVPFAHGRNWDARDGLDISRFTININEGTWMTDMDQVGTVLWKIISNTTLARQHYDAMQEARYKLLWAMPHNRVADYVLESTKRCINDDETAGSAACTNSMAAD